MRQRNHRAEQIRSTTLHENRSGYTRSTWKDTPHAVLDETGFAVAEPIRVMGDSPRAEAIVRRLLEPRPVADPLGPMGADIRRLRKIRARARKFANASIEKVATGG